MAQHIVLIPGLIGYKAVLREIAEPWTPKPSILTTILTDPHRTLYCETYDDMVLDFKPDWRSDIFRWRR